MVLYDSSKGKPTVPILYCISWSVGFQNAIGSQPRSENTDSQRHVHEIHSDVYRPV